MRHIYYERNTCKSTWWHRITECCFTRRQRNAPVFNLLRDWFWSFSTRRGDTLIIIIHSLLYRHDKVITSGVKFGMEEGRRRGPLLHAKFHPHRCKNKGTGPPKLKFLLRFDQNVEYKCPTGVYPLCDFQKICRVWTPFQDALAAVIPKFSVPP